MLPDTTFPKPGESIIVDGSPLVCEEYLRLLPQRRLACRAGWRGKRVFAKLYVNRWAGKREWKKECGNFQRLRQRKIETPSVLYSGVADNGEILVLITEWLDAVEAIKDAWQHADRASLVGSIAAHLADQHKAGVIQKDLHADNLVIRQGRILTLDYGRIAIKKSEIGKKRSLDNLALMLVQLHPMNEGLAAKALQEYMGRRGWKPTKNDRQYFDRSTERSLRNIRRKTGAKLFRSCTAFAVNRRDRWSWVYDRGVSFADQIPLLDWDSEADIQASMAQGEDKEYRSEIRGLMAEDAVAVWFPPHKKWNWSGLRERSLPSERAWIKAQALHYQSIPMEYPVAHGLRFERVLEKKGVLCVKKRTGEKLDAFFNAEDVSQESKGDVAAKLLEVLDHLRWTLIGIESLESAIRVDADGLFFSAPFRIEFHGDRAAAGRQMAETWGSFVQRFSGQPDLIKLFESRGFFRLASMAT